MPRSSPLVIELLARVRQRIRGYVWWEGLAVGFVWLAVTFWVGYGLDYLPVRLGASEMPREARIVMLVGISLVLAVILYRYILRRAFARLRDKSIALLIERKFPEFEDSLVTVVELTDRLAVPATTPTDRELAGEDLSEEAMERGMLDRALHKAERLAPQVEIEKVFDYWPLRRALAAAGLLAISLLTLAVLSWSSFRLGLSRLYGLSDATYPRQTYLQMDGFEEGMVTVARGSDFTVRVLADADRPVPPPDVCSIHYQTADGERGRVNMSRKGAPRDGFQRYTFDGKPFKSILSDITFDVVGNDRRLPKQRVRVVDSPQVVAIQIECEHPAYTKLAPATLEYYPGIKIPRGSRLQLRIITNKPLVEGQLTRKSSRLPSDPSAVLTDETETLLPLEPTDVPPVTGDASIVDSRDSANPESGRVLSYAIAQLNEDLENEIELLDTDGVRSSRPYRIALVSVPDFPPQVSIRVRGIGSAITTDARIPIEGEISDDYGVAQSWFELELPDDQVRAFDLAQSDGLIEDGLDLRQRRAAEVDPLTLEVGMGIVLSVKASDRYDLDEEANVGVSDRYELEIVSASELIALLEARELGLRQRFEQIVEEMIESRDSVNRIAVVPGETPSTSTEEQPVEGEEPERFDEPDRIEREASLRMIRVQRAEQQSQRGAAEVMGVALSFEDIRLELVNNRVDASDRVQRIERDISFPLREISEQLFPLLDARLEELRLALETESAGTVISNLTAGSIRQLDEIVVAMEDVLNKMLDLETYNELVDLVRSMIEDQEELTERTKERRKKEALELLK